MPEKKYPTLSGVAETMLVTLYLRAMEDCGVFLELGSDTPGYAVVRPVTCNARAGSSQNSRSSNSMPEKVLQSLDGVSETLLMTLYVRARESQRSNAMLKDDKAVAMINQIDCDFSRLRMQRHDEVAVIMRMSKFDSQVRYFLLQNPDSVVVHIGCGLDTRFERVDNGSVEWFDLDMPDVMELRQKFIQNECCHTTLSHLFSRWLV
jgi:O-methyltransferase involved in polyketide biosynthesis